MLTKTQSLDDLTKCKTKKNTIRKVKSEGDISCMSKSSRIKLNKRDIVKMRKVERQYGRFIANTFQDFFFARELVHNHGIENVFFTVVMLYSIEPEYKDKSSGSYITNVFHEQTIVRTSLGKNGLVGAACFMKGLVSP